MTPEELRDWYRKTLQDKNIVIKHIQAQLSSKEQECAQLKIDASNHAYQCDKAKQERDKAEAENSSLRAECERLKAELKTTEETLADKDRKLYNNDLASLRADNESLTNIISASLRDDNIESLRKRCEDLEAKMKENMMIAFTAGHCMVPGDVSFEQWYKELFLSQ